MDYDYQPQDLLQEERHLHIIPVSAGTRFGNYLIDSIVIGVINAGLGAVLGLASVNSYNMYQNDNLALSIFISLAPGFVIRFLYFFILESNGGVTVGKLITNTRVISETGYKASAKEILIRSLCRFIPFNAFSFLGGGVGWHDTISITRVITKDSYNQMVGANY